MIRLAPRYGRGAGVGPGSVDSMKSAGVDARTTAGLETGATLPLFPALFADLDIQPLDFLVQRRERDAELFGGVGLVPVAALEFLDDDAALDDFENIEERGVGIVLEERILKAAARDVAGEQVGADDL